MTPRAGIRLERLLAGGFVVAYLALAIASVPRLSLTFDEHLYIPAGRLYWTERDFDVNRIHPPLAKLVAGAPLLAMDLRTAESDSLLERIPREGPSWEDYRWAEAFLMDDNLGRFDAIVRASRLAMLVFPLLLLGVVYGWSRSLFGPVGGLVSLTVAVFDPDVLAYGPLAVTDLAMASLFAASVYLLWSHVRAPSRWKRNLLGPVLGLALLAKYSNLLLLPVLAVLVVVASLAGRADLLDLLDPAPREEGGDRRRRAAIGAAIVALGLLVTLWAGYLFTGSPLGYLEGLRDLRIHAGTEYEAFLLGRYSRTGFWYYYPVALALKVPLATLGLAALGTLLLARSKGRDAFTGACLAVPPVLLVVAMTIGTLQIGHRYVLGVLPFLFVLCGGVGPWMAKNLRAERARSTLPVFLVGWTAVAGVRSHPFHLSYHNALVPSDLAFFDALDGSNNDWYHGWREVARMQAEGALDPVVPIYVLDIVRGWLRPYGIRYAPIEVTEKEPAPGTYLFSAYDRRLLRRFREERSAPTPLLDDYEPTGVIAGSVLVVRVPERPEPEPGPLRTETTRYPDGSVRSRYQVVDLADGRTVAHGPYTVRSPDGSPLEEGSMRLGVPHGPYRLYHPGGVLAEEGATWRGDLHGTVRRWAPDGSPIDERRYWQGVEVVEPGR